MIGSKKAEVREPKKRGKCLVLTTVGELGLYTPIENAPADCRTAADVKKWMKKTSYVGIVNPIRVLDPIRAKQETVTKFV